MNATERIRQAMTEFSNRRPDQAMKLLKQALELEPENVYALANLGNLLLLGRDAGAAEDPLRQALALDPRNVPAAFGLAKALIAQQRFDEALPILQSVRDEEAPPDQQAEFYQLIGIVLAGKRDWDAAITFFGKYAERRPGQLDPVLCLHKAHLGKGDRKGAAIQMERAVEMDPGKSPLWVRLVTLYQQLREPILLRTGCAKMLAAHPGDMSLANLAVRLLGESGQYAYAARICRRALDRSPDVDRTQYPDLARMEGLL